MTIVRWERNQVQPNVSYIPRIIDFLGYALLETVRSFPEILRAYRRAAGLSQERLAKQARIDESTIAKWERGETRPMAATLRRVMQFFEHRFDVCP